MKVRQTSCDSVFVGLSITSRGATVRVEKLTKRTEISVRFHEVLIAELGASRCEITLILHNFRDHRYSNLHHITK